VQRGALTAAAAIATKLDLADLKRKRNLTVKKVEKSTHSSSISMINIELPSPIRLP
jgi:hypothetical protein